jgi:hypothetical protein
MQAAAARVAPDLLYEPGFLPRTQGTTRRRAPEVSRPESVRPRRCKTLGDRITQRTASRRDQ